MTTQRLFGIILVVVGAILLVIGLNASDSIADRMSNFFTGHFTDATTWYLVIGVTALIVGVVLLACRGRRRLI
jgi:drug/metabolite transporter (DMT)-like permease